MRTAEVLVLLAALAGAAAPWQFASASPLGRALLTDGTNHSMVEYCIPGAANKTAVADCTEILSAYNVDGEGGIMFECVAGGSPQQCIDDVVAKRADITTLATADDAAAVQAGLARLDEGADGAPTTEALYGRAGDPDAAATQNAIAALGADAAFAAFYAGLEPNSTAGGGNATDVAPPPAPPSVNATLYRFCIPDASGDDAKVRAECDAAFKNVTAASGGAVAVECVEGGSPTACAQLIFASGADFTKFGASDIYRARLYDVGVLAQEALGKGGEASEYYAVAVVPKAACDASPEPLTLADLKGRRAAMTGYRKNAGWTLPMGYMRDAGVFGTPPTYVDRGAEADADIVSRFFGTVCAPGTDSSGPGHAAEGNGTARGGVQYAPLCEGCKDPATCAPAGAEDQDAYANYDGPVRALAEGAADVAFTKAGEVEAYVEANGGDAGDYRLLCPRGGCAEVAKFESCNIAAAPSHAFVGRGSGYADTPEGKALVDALLAAADADGGAWIKGNTETLTKTLLFTKGTTGLTAVPGGRPEGYFSADTLAAYTGQANFQSIDEYAPASTDDGGGGGLSTGAIVGIVIAALVVVGAAVAGAVVVKKKRAAKKSDYSGFAGEEIGSPIAFAP